MMIRLPHIKSWTYHSSPSDSMPFLSKYGVLINLDTIGKVEILGEDNTVLGDFQIPLSFEAIQREWSLGRRDISEINPNGEPIPYAASWEGKFAHQMKELPYSKKKNPYFQE